MSTDAWATKRRANSHTNGDDNDARNSTRPNGT